MTLGTNPQSSNLNVGKDGAPQDGPKGEFVPPAPMQNYPQWPQYPPYYPNQWDPYYPPYPQQEPTPQDPPSVKNESPPNQQNPNQQPAQIPPPNPQHLNQEPLQIPPPNPQDQFQQPPQVPPPQDPYQPSHVPPPPHGLYPGGPPPPQDLYQSPNPYDYPPYPYYNPYDPQGYYPPDPYGYSGWGEPAPNYYGDWQQLSQPPQQQSQPPQQPSQPPQDQNHDFVPKDEPDNVVDNSKETKDEPKASKAEEMVESVDKDMKVDAAAVESSNLGTSVSLETTESSSVENNTAPVSEVKSESKPEIKENLTKSEYSEWFFDDPQLPAGWISRSYTVMAYGKPCTEFEFLSPEQKLFSSLSSLIGYMKTVGTFPKEFMEKLIVNKSGSVEMEQMLISSLNGRPTVPTVQEDQNNKMNSGHFTEWLEDDSLPVGWKRRSREFVNARNSTGKSTKYQYLSDKQEIFESRLGVIDYMKNSGMYSNEEIEKVSSGSKRSKSNFENDETLPEGWKKKIHMSKTSGQIQGYSYLCPNTKKIFRSRREVISYMQNSEMYPMDVIQDAIEKGQVFRQNFDRVKNLKPIVKSERQEVYKKQLWEQYNDWVDDETLPTGWKKRSYQHKDSHTKTGMTTKYQYLSQSKKIFNARSSVIDYMTKSGMFTIEEIEKVKSGRFNGKMGNKSVIKKVFTDWTADESLPMGWKKRSYNAQWHGRIITKYQYMSPNEEKFDARSAIIEFMNKSGTYSTEEIEKVKSGSRKGNKAKNTANKETGVQRVTQKKFTEWEEDETLPQGWKKRSYEAHWKNGTHTKYQYLSPNNDKYETRAGIIEYMTKSGMFTTEEMEKVRSGKRSGRKSGESKISEKKVDYNDWEEDESLPSGWKKRSYEKIWKNKKVIKYQYVSPINEHFESRSSVIEFMKTSGTFSVEEIEKVNAGKKSVKISKISKTDWENDETLPEGWKKRAHIYKSSGNILKYSYLCPNQQKIFTSRKEVLSYMQSSDIYPMDVIQDAIEKGKILREASSQKSTEVDLNWQDVKYDWKDDETLPEGWKKSSYIAKSSGQLKQNFYLCPNKENILTSRRAVIKYMKNSGLYSDDQVKTAIEKCKSKLQKGNKENKVFDWKDDESLPIGWKKRTYEVKWKNKKITKYQYLSPTNEKFETRLSVIKFMKTSEMYTDYEIEKVKSGRKSFTRGKSIKVVLDKTSVLAKPNWQDEKYDWEDDKTLPQGWTKSSYITKSNGKLQRNSYLCPNKENMFTSKKAVIEFIQNSNMYSEDQIKTAMENYKSKPTVEKKQKKVYDWEDDETLPAGWKKRSFIIKGKSGTFPQHRYLSTDMKIFNSRASVIEYMKKSGTFSSEDIEKVKSGRSGGQYQEFHDWKDDDSLPIGWKKRSYVVKGKSGIITQHRYLSEKQKIYKSRASIIAYMKKSEMYTDYEIEKVERGKHVITYKWEDDETLPEGWKRSAHISNSSTAADKLQKYYYLCPASQKVFTSRNEVVTYMQNSDMYTQFVIDNVRKNIKYSQEKLPKIERNEKETNAGVLSQLLERLPGVEISQTKQKIVNEKVPISEIVLTKGAEQELTTIEMPLPATNEITHSEVDSDSLSTGKSYDWVVDESLPKGWKKRYVNYKCKNAKGELRTTKQCRYLSPSQKTFNSRVQVVAFMKKSEEYTEEDILAVKQGKSKSSKSQGTIKNEGIETKKNIDEAEAIPESKTEENSKNNPTKYVCSSWEFDNEMLPEGWRKRSFINSNNIQVFQYIGESENIFQSTKEVFDFIRYSRKHTLDDALKFLAGVKKQEKLDDNTIDLKEDIQYEFECDYCAQQFFASNEKISHQQREHAGQVRYKCNDCRCRNLKKASLFFHIQSKHWDVASDDQITFDVELPVKPKQVKQVRIKAPQSKRRKVQETTKKVRSDETKYENTLELVGASVEDQDNEVSSVDEMSNDKTESNEESSTMEEDWIIHDNLEPNNDNDETKADSVDDLGTAIVGDNEEGSENGTDSFKDQNKGTEQNVESIEIEENCGNDLVQENSESNEENYEIETDSVDDIETSGKNDTSVSEIVKDNMQQNVQNCEMGKEFTNDQVREDTEQLEENDEVEKKSVDSIGEEDYEIDNQAEDYVLNHNYETIDELVNNIELSEEPYDMEVDDDDIELDGENYEGENNSNNEAKIESVDYESKFNEEESAENNDMENESGESDIHEDSSKDNGELDIEEDCVEIIEENMLENPELNNSDDEIEVIETITQQEWVSDPTLPEGWKRRPLIGHSNERKKDGSMVVTKYQYLSPEEDIFNSRKEIMKYMDIYTNIPNAEQISKLSMDYDNEMDLHSTDDQQHKDDFEQENDWYDEEQEDLGNYDEIDLYEEDQQEQIKENFGSEKEPTEEQFAGEEEEGMGNNENNGEIEENISIENCSDKPKDLSVPVGPKVMIERSNYEMLSTIFIRSPNPSRAVMQDIAEDAEMSVKDVKWFFIKMRHKFEHNKGEEVDTVAVQEAVDFVRTNYADDEYIKL